jgi:hypothetical protein
LSKTVPDAMSVQGFSSTKETEQFIRLVDQFFDCLNVNSTYKGQKKINKALYPYRDLDDWRFKV